MIPPVDDFDHLKVCQASKEGLSKKLQINKSSSTSVLSEGIREKLRQQDITFIANATDLGSGNLWQHSRKSARNLLLEGEEAIQLKSY